MTEPLDVLQFSTGDTNGGAAQAAYRLHRALAASGHRSQLIVRQKYSDAADVEEVPAYLNVWRARGRRLARRLRIRRDAPAAPPAFNLDLPSDIERHRFYGRRADVLVLHSVTRLLSVGEIRNLWDYYRVPVVWALADQAPLTGGCHYSYDCDGYERRCGFCPQLESTVEADRSRVVWTRKSELLRDLPIVFVAPSTPAAGWVRASSVFASYRVDVIPAITDPVHFRPVDPLLARGVLGVPQSAAIVLVGAGNVLSARKGIRQFALPALRRLVQDGGGENLFVLVLGAGGEKIVSELPCPGRALGSLTDAVAVALAFQAADVFLCTSIADAGPLMIPESLLCGTPVVSFDVGYAVDLVKSGETGFVATARDSDELAKGLADVLRTSGALREQCAAAARHHTPDEVVRRHYKLYRSLLG